MQFDKFIRIYTIVVLILILAALIGAGYSFFVMSYPVYSVACVFLAIIFALMLFVTRSLVSRNRPKDKKRGAHW